MPSIASTRVSSFLGRLKKVTRTSGETKSRSVSPDPGPSTPDAFFSRLKQAYELGVSVKARCRNAYDPDKIEKFSGKVRRINHFGHVPTTVVFVEGHPYGFYLSNVLELTTPGIVARTSEPAAQAPKPPPAAYKPPAPRIPAGTEAAYEALMKTVTQNRGGYTGVCDSRYAMQRLFREETTVALALAASHKQESGEITFSPRPSTTACLLGTSSVSREVDGTLLSAIRVFFVNDWMPYDYVTSTLAHEAVHNLLSRLGGSCDPVHLAVMHRLSTGTDADANAAMDSAIDHYRSQQGTTSPLPASNRAVLEQQLPLLRNYLQQPDQSVVPSDLIPGVLTAFNTLCESEAEVLDTAIENDRTMRKSTFCNRDVESLISGAHGDAYHPGGFDKTDADCRRMARIEAMARLLEAKMHNRVRDCDVEETCPELLTYYKEKLLPALEAYVKEHAATHGWASLN